MQSKKEVLLSHMQTDRRLQRDIHIKCNHNNNNNEGELYEKRKSC